MPSVLFSLNALALSGLANFQVGGTRVPYLHASWQAFGCEPNALPTQQLIDDKEVRNNQKLGFQTFGRAEMPSDFRSND